MTTSSREAIRRRYLPDVVVQTHEGKAALFYQDLVKDRIVVLNFMYLNCESTCPTTLHNLMQVHTRLKSRFGRGLAVNVERRAGEFAGAGNVGPAGQGELGVEPFARGRVHGADGSGAARHAGRTQQ